MGDFGGAQALKRFRVFDEDRARVHRFDGADQILGRITGIERRRDRAVCQDAEVGEIELEPRFGIERDYVALGDSYIVGVVARGTDVAFLQTRLLFTYAFSGNGRR